MASTKIGSMWKAVIGFGLVRMFSKLLTKSPVKTPAPAAAKAPSKGGKVVPIRQAAARKKAVKPAPAPQKTKTTRQK